jgi:ketosteroid isomerase-like protein
VAGVVERYLAAIAAQNWNVVAECIADDVVRVGPYGDRYSGREDYLTFIAELMSRLSGYSMDLRRVTYSGDALAFAELNETTEMDGTPHRTSEVLVFAIDEDGHIGRVDIFIQQPQPVR